MPEKLIFEIAPFSGSNVEAKETERENSYLCG